MPNWTVQIVDMNRGSDARTALEQANSATLTPPSNFEYLLVKIKVKCNYTDKDQHSISASDFKVTGDRLVAYNPMDVTVPEPALDNVLQAGEETQGWAAYVVGKNEHDLILAVDEIANDSPDRIRYIAIEGGRRRSVFPIIWQTSRPLTWVRFLPNRPLAASKWSPTNGKCQFST